MPLNIPANQAKQKITALLKTFIDVVNLSQTPEKVIDRIYNTNLLIDSDDIDNVKKGYLISYHTDNPIGSPVLSIILVSDYQHQLPAKPDFVIEFNNGIPDEFNALMLPIAGDRYEPVVLTTILNSVAAINELCNIKPNEIVKKNHDFIGIFNYELELQNTPITAKLLNNDQQATTLLALILIISESQFTINP